ncbi:PREDICTED: uncharacterized protein LOC109187167 [Ipomoea nil]|uniref:uncharacterized protein LOC109187167 n=1 Tax=Ipomoea nil TaxID=35883 RepID=UPI0009009E91|nr:PREDICTED: uncharacterized protein LOC109187167 [Ipomoea nil]
MDTSQIEERCAALSLIEEDASGLEAPDVQACPDASIKNNLVGRFLTDRPIKFEFMQQILASVWRPVMGMQVLALTDELFLFQFPHPKDLNRVLEDGPWTFENSLLICETVPPETRPEDVKLDTVCFWAQIHGLPSVFATKEFLAKIGDYLGSFITVDPGNFGGSWRSYFRIRVRMDINAPLKRRMKLLRKDGSSQWVSFRYERLGTFCFCCRVLGHVDKFCKRVYEEGTTPEEFPFGPWMRAGPRRQVRPVVAKWLLSSQATLMTPSNVPAAGPTPRATVSLEENGGIQGELKRRREDSGSSGNDREDDVTMLESVNILPKAGLEGQARLDQ